MTFTPFNEFLACHIVICDRPDGLVAANFLSTASPAIAARRSFPAPPIVSYHQHHAPAASVPVSFPQLLPKLTPAAIGVDRPQAARSGLKAAFFSVLRGTIAAYKWLKVLMDTDLCTRPPRAFGERNFVKPAELPKGCAR
jgi:hypothetical protein